MELTQAQKNKLKKLALIKDFESKGAFPLLDYTIELAENYEKDIPELRELVDELTSARPDRDEIREIIGEIVSGINIPEAINGERGEKGDKGDKGDRGEKGLDGKNGKDGLNGKDGKDGVDGLDGKDGQDFTPDLKTLTIDVINTLELGDDKLDAKAIKNLPTYTDEIKTLQNRTQLLNQITSGLERRIGTGGNVDLSAYVPYIGATGNLKLGTYDLWTDDIVSSTSAGLSLWGLGGVKAMLIGAGGGNNVTFYDGVKLDAKTASKVLLTDSNKNIVTSTLSASDLEDIPTTYWKNDGSSTATGNWDIGTNNLIAKIVKANTEGFTGAGNEIMTGFALRGNPQNLGDGQAIRWRWIDTGADTARINSLAVGSSSDVLEFWTSQTGNFSKALTIGETSSSFEGSLTASNLSGTNTGDQESFETFNKNLKSYPYEIEEVSSTVTTITYDTGGGSIVKTITEVSPTVTTIALSGITAGLPTTKTITEGLTTLITYS